MDFICNASPEIIPVILPIAIIGMIVAGIELLCQHYDKNNDNNESDNDKTN